MRYVVILAALAALAGLVACADLRYIQQLDCAETWPTPVYCER
jgi:hypothetical protein